MKKKANTIQLEGKNLSIEISPNDPLTWKLTMLLEAAFNQGSSSIEDIATKYGYTREYFYQVLQKYKEHGSEGLRNKSPGPKTNYKRTEVVIKQVLRHRFLDPQANCGVIAQKLKQAGYDVSQRSVERTINEYGLQKKGFIGQILKKMSGK